MKTFNSSLEKIYFPVEKASARTLFPGYSFPSGKDTVVYTPTGNRILNVCSSGYKLISNESLFSPIYEDLAARFGHDMIEVKVKNVDNRKFYVSLIIKNQPYQVQKGDIVNPTIELQNSYDGTLKFGLAIGFQRVVCTNGMMAFEQAAMQKSKHFSGSVDLERMYLMLEGVDSQLERFKKLTERRLTPKEIEEITLQIKEHTKFPPLLLPQVSEVIAREQIKLNAEPTSWLLYHGFNNRLNHADIKMHQEFKARIDLEVLEIIETLN